MLNVLTSAANFDEMSTKVKFTVKFSSKLREVENLFFGRPVITVVDIFCFCFVKDKSSNAT